MHWLLACKRTCVWSGYTWWVRTVAQDGHKWKEDNSRERQRGEGSERSNVWTKAAEPRQRVAAGDGPTWKWPTLGLAGAAAPGGACRFTWGCLQPRENSVKQTARQLDRSWCFVHCAHGGWAVRFLASTPLAGQASTYAMLPHTAQQHVHSKATHAHSTRHSRATHAAQG